VGEINKNAGKIYEENEINIMKELCAGIPGPVIIDVGANIGLMSLNLYEFIPHSKIYAFEPGPFQFSPSKANNRIQ
jgi:precorrin-6B methylase 2